VFIFLRVEKFLFGLCDFLLGKTKLRFFYLFLHPYKFTPRLVIFFMVYIIFLYAIMLKLLDFLILNLPMIS